MSEENNSESINPGEALKREREKLGLSLNDIALSTKISARVLKALEEGDRSELPPRSFTRGFIRSYANYLKIDPQPIMDAYDDDPNSAAPDPLPDPTEENEKIETLNDSSTANKIFVAGGLLVLVFLIIGVKQLVDRYAEERAVDKVSEGVRPLVLPEEAERTKKANGSPQPPPTQAQQEPKEEEAADTSATTGPRVQEVIIEAMDRVNVTARLDGGGAQRLSLTPESFHVLKAAREIALDISDGGRVNIIHNGTDVGNPGALGRSVRVTYP